MPLTAKRTQPALAALSLANLCLVRIWAGLLGETTGQVSAGWTQVWPSAWYGAALLNLALLTALIWSVWRWGRPLGQALLALALAALFAKELTIALAAGSDPWKHHVAILVESGIRRGWLWPVAALSLAALGWAIGRTQLRWLPHTLVALSPIAAVTAGQATWRLLAAPSPPAELRCIRHEALTNTAARTPFVWIVFDELDERIAFAQRPPGLRLPALDAFRAESVVFRQAFSPSADTADSIPAMLNPILPRPGLRTALVGWHLPYCRTYGQYLESCQAWPMDRQLNSFGSGLLPAAGNQLRSLLESSLYSVFGQSLAIESHGQTVLRMEAAAAAIVADPRFDLIFLHLPTPHPPFVYDPQKRDLSARNQDARGYFGNLALADRIFANIRASLTRTGRWAQTHVLVTGDHGYRQAARLGYPPEDKHVPWMWKPAGSVQPRQLEKRFETCHTSGLIAHLLDGEPAESIIARYP